ncbi:hypothetical protein [Kitasatospora sp. NPDC088351]|uniref:hypothetical protein n=1 Tax=unclassified Kitasatospora TaxID=2633591 RepID=UPI00341B3808
MLNSRRPPTGAALRAVFGTPGLGRVCGHGIDTIKSYGFLPLPAFSCGSTI